MDENRQFRGVLIGDEDGVADGLLLVPSDDVQAVFDEIRQPVADVRFRPGWDACDRESGPKSTYISTSGSMARHRPRLSPSARRCR